MSTAASFDQVEEDVQSTALVRHPQLLSPRAAWLKKAADWSQLACARMYGMQSMGLAW
jgi:hypothetical protein